MANDSQKHANSNYFTYTYKNTYTYTDIAGNEH